MASDVNLVVLAEAPSLTLPGAATTPYAKASRHGGIRIGPSIPDYGEISSYGNTYSAGSTTDIAPVAAIPTTSAHFIVWNGESQSGGGKNYYIQSASYMCSTSAGAILQQTLIAMVSTVVLAAPSVTAGIGPKNLAGVASSSKATIGSAATVVNNGIWQPITNSNNFGAQTPTIGMSSWVDLRGIYVVPPGCVFALAVMCQSAASAKNQLFVSWTEAP